MSVNECKSTLQRETALDEVHFRIASSSGCWMSSLESYIYALWTSKNYCSCASSQKIVEKFKWKITIQPCIEKKTKTSTKKKKVEYIPAPQTKPQEKVVYFLKRQCLAIKGTEKEREILLIIKITLVNLQFLIDNMQNFSAICLKKT